jgi:hypothetical protein
MESAIGALKKGIENKVYRRWARVGLLYEVLSLWKIHKILEKNLTVSNLADASHAGGN